MKFTSLFCIAALLIGLIPLMPQAAALAADQKLVPINIELPKPMFVGTPTPMKVERLEKPTGKPRPPFLAPEGTKNVALGKPVTSSDDLPVIGELSMITDGDKEAADGSYVELGPFKQWVQVDLGARHAIYAIVMWHYHKQPRVYYDVVVQIADDPDFTKNVVTVFNNDIDNSLGFGKGEDWHYVETNEGKLVDCKGTIGRYVRAYTAGNTSNDLNHWIELEVYGKPAK
ncbi:MAG: discoidin domain-containing protein [candidate division KSB1 bacterium]|nr:discoidin domain-containing protein [candidate division KSB1 bacterium]MDZ7346545.1 discoidin domain-containing protein [candidate division KSB1 bacterium]